MKSEEFVCKYCGKNCGNNSSNLKKYKKECKHGKADKLPLLVYECDSCRCKLTNRSNLHQHIASSPHCRTKIEQLQKGKSSMTSNKKTKKKKTKKKNKTESVSDSSKSATRHNGWTGKQKPSFGTTFDTENVKEHPLCQPKAQSTELVKQSKAKIKHTESSKQSSQSKSVCEQDNADFQTTTKGDKPHHSRTQEYKLCSKSKTEILWQAFQ